MAGYFMYVSARGGHGGDHPTLETPDGEKVAACLIFYFNIYVTITYHSLSWNENFLQSTREASRR